MMFGGTVWATIVMLSDLLSVPVVLVAVTVKLNVPAVVGVPEITPELERLSPDGGLPDHVIGVVPVAVRVWEYAIPTVPLLRVVVVIVGLAVTVTEKDSSSLYVVPWLRARIVKLNVPVAEGVPEINPLLESSSPVGKVPLWRFQVNGAVPVACNCTLYAAPTVPLGKLVVVIETGQWVLNVAWEVSETN